MWKEILKYFVQNLKEKDEVEGVLLFGDRAIGYYNDSDPIELCVIVNNKEDYETSPYLEEVEDLKFITHIYDIDEIKQRLEKEYKKYKKTMASNILTGKILYDAYGNLASLKDLALDYHHKLFPALKNIKKIRNNIEFIGRNLINKVEDDDFDFQYFLAVNKILEYYFRYLGVPYYPVKTYRYLADEEYAKENLYPKVEDRIFTNFVVKALTAKSKDEKLTVIENLVKHLLIEMR